LEGLTCIRKEVSQPLCDLLFLHSEAAFQTPAFKGEGCEPAPCRATTVSFSSKDAPPLLAQGGAGEDTDVKNTETLHLAASAKLYK